MATDRPALGWWVEIITNFPYCIYYFGPFDSDIEANSYKYGYLEDLQLEGADINGISTKFIQPQELTIEVPEMATQESNHVSPNTLYQHNYNLNPRRNIAQIKSAKST